MSYNKVISMDAPQKEPLNPTHLLWSDFHADVAQEQQISQEASPLRIIVPRHGNTRSEETYLANIFGPKSCDLKIISFIKVHSHSAANQNPNRERAGAATAQTAVQQSQ